MAAERSDSLFLTVEDCARLLGLPLRQTYGLLEADAIPHAHKGKGTGYVIHRREIEQYIANGRRPMREPPTADEIAEAILRKLPGFLAEHGIPVIPVQTHSLNPVVHLNKKRA